jgi:hypothetical protein
LEFLKQAIYVGKLTGGHSRGSPSVSCIEDWFSITGFWYTLFYLLLRYLKCFKWFSSAFSGVFVLLWIVCYLIYYYFILVFRYFD